MSNRQFPSFHLSPNYDRITTRLAKKQSDYNEFIEACASSSAASVDLPNEFVKDWITNWCDDVVDGPSFYYRFDTLENLNAAVEDITTIVDIMRDQRNRYLLEHHVYVFEIAEDPRLGPFPTSEAVKARLSPAIPTTLWTGEANAFLMEKAGFLLNNPTNQQIATLNRFMWHVDISKPRIPIRMPRVALIAHIPDVAAALDVTYPPLTASMESNEIIRLTHNWLVEQAWPAIRRIRLEAEATIPEANNNEAETPPAADRPILRVNEPLPIDSFAELRKFAQDKLKGQERAVIEALCNAAGTLPIADLALKGGVGWDDPTQGFRNAQQRLSPKLKPLCYTLVRQDGAAKLILMKS